MPRTSPIAREDLWSIRGWLNNVRIRLIAFSKVLLNYFKHREIVFELLLGRAPHHPSSRLIQLSWMRQADQRIRHMNALPHRQALSMFQRRAQMKLDTEIADRRLPQLPATQRLSRHFSQLFDNVTL